VKLADTRAEWGGNDAQETAASSGYRLFAAESIQKTQTTVL